MSATLCINPLTLPLYVMAKPVGPQCNMDCAYCYYLEKDQLYTARKSFKMTDQLLDRFTEHYIQAQPTPHVQFTWHGGEALLRGLDFYRKAVGLQRLHGAGRTIVNSIQTNGLLVNDAWCRFFKDNDFLVGISIDGPEHLHDAYRTDGGGKGTFARVMRAIELFHKHGVAFNTLGVIHSRNSAYPVEIYRFLKQIGSQYMQFTPIVERLGTRSDGLELLTAANNPVGAELAPWCVDPVQYGQFYIQLFNEWVKHDVGRYYVQLFDATLACVVGVPPGVCLYAQTCGHALVMEHNGDVYACDHFVYPEYCLGNLNTHSLVGMMLSAQQTAFGQAKQQALPAVCRACPYVSLCNGECPKNRFCYTPDGEYGLNYLCEGLKLYFEHTLPFMQAMAHELNNKRSPAGIMQSARVRQLP